jgi:hypothetical protein
VPPQAGRDLYNFNDDEEDRGGRYSKSGSKENILLRAFIQHQRQKIIELNAEYWR